MRFWDFVISSSHLPEYWKRTVPCIPAHQWPRADPCHGLAAQRTWRILPQHSHVRPQQLPSNSFSDGSITLLSFLYLMMFWHLLNVHTVERLSSQSQPVLRDSKAEAKSSSFTFKLTPKYFPYLTLTTPTNKHPALIHFSARYQASRDQPSLQPTGIIQKNPSEMFTVLWPRLSPHCCFCSRAQLGLRLWPCLVRQGMFPSLRKCKW